MSTKFNTRPVLDTLSDGLTLALMAGLTFASAAAMASPMHLADEAAPILLPTVVVTAQKPIHLPTVVLTAKKSVKAPSV
ncbi:hypothetical protein [Inhella gelatinilytica]|uniref:Uncharacterized protein n=1 Tax=Inhella gelatinilytica TaxID=2795030 RepID=A0A931IXV1_9BURK|nr:hypothetical protein [Inhella gelatinilytica]MBH9553586.1 hypothetical protein [Inhella gelatinilytica]